MKGTAETWSYTEYFLKNFFERGFVLVHDTAGRAQWGNGSAEHPLPAGARVWKSFSEMMEGNGYTRLNCACWVKGSGDHGCHLNYRRVLA